MVTIDLNCNHETPSQRFLIATKARSQALKYASRFLADIAPAEKGREWTIIESPCVNPECLCRYQCLLNSTE